MDRRISVAFLPKLVNSDSLCGATVVVTDVLRATTTMISALANGALEIIPTPDISTALRLKSELGAEVVLGGERGGVIIPGFHQGNSPREFTPEVIGGKRLVLCTTNGTVAMESCRGADQVVIGAFVNLGAVVQCVASIPRLLIVCAGTDGQITGEDVLFAGALIERLQVGNASMELDDQAQIAVGWWQAAKQRISAGEPLAKFLGQGLGGRNLLKLKYDDDIQFCAQVDILPHVPQLDLAQWSIRLR
jgi:2-phosphosulfolactate phosphatase